MPLYPSVHATHQIHKRIRRLSDARPTDLVAVLKSDRDGLSKYPARAAFLQSLNIPDEAVLGLLKGLGSDFATFLSIIDLNLFQPNIMHIINDFSVRGVPMTTLNIRGHSFCMGDKELILKSFISSYGHQRWPCDVATYVARNIFSSDRRISVNVLSGGGVRDVLISEWCKTYNLTPGCTPPQVMIFNSESGGSFLIPYLP